MDNIIKLSELNTDYLVFKDPKDNASGGKAIPVRYNCPRRGEILLMFKTPRMDLPYGVSQWPLPQHCTDKNSNEIKYALDMAMTGKDVEKANVFYRKMQELESAIHARLQKDSKRLVGKQCSLEVIQDKCNDLVKNDRPDSTRPACIKLKLRRDEKDKIPQNTFSSVDVYKAGSSAKVFLTVNGGSEGGGTSTTGESISDVFERRSSVKGLVALYSLSLINGNISIPLRPIQLQVYPGMKQITTNVFFGDDSDDECDSVSTTPPSVTPSPPTTSVTDTGPLADEPPADTDEVDEETVVPRTNPFAPEASKKSKSKTKSSTSSSSESKPKKKKEKKVPPPPEPDSESDDSDDEVEHLMVSSDSDDDN